MAALNLAYLDLVGLHRFFGMWVRVRAVDPIQCFLLARQAVLDLYLKCYVVCYWRHVSRHERAGNSRAATTNRPIVKEASAKRWMNCFERHRPCEMTLFTVVVLAIRSNFVSKAARLNYFVHIQVSRLGQWSRYSLGESRAEVIKMWMQSLHIPTAHKRQGLSGFNLELWQRGIREQGTDANMLCRNWISCIKSASRADQKWPHHQEIDKRETRKAAPSDRDTFQKVQPKEGGVVSEDEQQQRKQGRTQLYFCSPLFLVLQQSLADSHGWWLSILICPNTDFISSLIKAICRVWRTWFLKPAVLLFPYRTLVLKAREDHCASISSPAHCHVMMMMMTMMMIMGLLLL